MIQPKKDLKYEKDIDVAINCHPEKILVKTTAHLRGICKHAFKNINSVLLLIIYNTAFEMKDMPSDMILINIYYL